LEHSFFEHPILNSPYEYPSQYWELDESGQPTNRIMPARRPAAFITPIPKPKKQRTATAQPEMVFDKVSEELSAFGQRYDPTPVINDLRRHIERWRQNPNPSQWNVTPETARLLQHWRHHKFSSLRPFFCQAEAVETVTTSSRSGDIMGTKGTFSFRARDFPGYDPGSHPGSCSGAAALDAARTTRKHTERVAEFSIRGQRECPGNDPNDPRRSARRTRRKAAKPATRE
jgi:hypothetical protein